MIHLPAIHLDDIPEPLHGYLREHREARYLLIRRGGGLAEWGYFDADGDAWIHACGAELATPLPTAEVEALAADSFYEVER